MRAMYAEELRKLQEQAAKQQRVGKS